MQPLTEAVWMKEVEGHSQWATIQGVQNPLVSCGTSQAIDGDQGTQFAGHYRQGWAESPNIEW